MNGLRQPDPALYFISFQWFIAGKMLQKKSLHTFVHKSIRPSPRPFDALSALLRSSEAIPQNIVAAKITKLTLTELQSMWYNDSYNVIMISFNAIMNFVIKLTVLIRYDGNSFCDW